MKKLAEIVGSLSSSKLPNIWRGVSVRLIELVLKTRDRETGPGVRIPPPSLKYQGGIYENCFSKQKN